jgi:hypothetical protein
VCRPIERAPFAKTTRSTNRVRLRAASREPAVPISAFIVGRENAQTLTLTAADSADFIVANNSANAIQRPQAAECAQRWRRRNKTNAPIPTSLEKAPPLDLQDSSAFRILILRV